MGGGGLRILCPLPLKNSTKMGGGERGFGLNIFSPFLVFFFLNGHALFTATFYKNDKNNINKIYLHD